ncbi:hypothetical protein DPMN_082085 [Dreissena polymorpha]|uniref:PHD-type domain-containing protein n=1 Tax=Dreissena polymorpha TaxID=45954 RepID=A0A9D4BGI5_DREPO|nr:hypothetical protein DPMN_082085 [Dreissena polymorpha]
MSDKQSDSSNTKDKMAATGHPPPTKVVNKGARRKASVNTADRERSASRDSMKSSSRNVSPSKSAVWTCDTCNEKFSNENDCLFTCQYCDVNHRCLKCLGIPTTAYKAVGNRIDMPWFCTVCLEKTLKTLKDQKSIEDRCSDYLSDFSRKIEERLTKMEADMVGIRDDMGVMREELMKEIKDTKVISADEAVSSAETDAGVSKVSAKKIVGKSDEQIMNSIQERIDRKNNIAFYNIPEGSGNIKNEKIEHD